MRWMIRTACVVLVSLAASSSAIGDAFDERATLDVLQIQLIGRDLHAIDARGGNLIERLEIGESIRWQGSRGLVGMVLTDRRVLAASARSARWQSERYLRTETPPADALLGERIAVWLSSKRALVLDGQQGTLSSESLGPLERIVATRLGANVGVVVTNRRALGTAPRLGGFVGIHLTPNEGPAEVTVTGNVATVLTRRRLLTFRGPVGSWGERRRKIR